VELLILFALASWAGCGPVGHWRKTEPLRIAERRQRSAQGHERRMARVARRGGRPTITEAISLRIVDRVVNPRGGPAQRAVAEWWADSWLYATERRRTRHSKAANGQLRRQRAARAATEWVANRRRPSDAQGAPARPQRDPWARPRSHHQGDVEDDIVDAELVDDPDEPAGPEERTATQPGRPGDPRVGQPAATGTPTQPPAPGAEAREDTNDNHKSSDNEAPTEIWTDVVVVQQGRGTHPRPDELDPEAGSSVHPIRPIGKDTNDMTTHTVISGETLDPSAGLEFVRSVRESTEQIMTQIELSETTLTSRGVTGEPVALLAQMREAFSTAVASCGAAVTHFERHLSIQDQVLADPTLAGSVHGTYVGTRS
jgi:hypothetical protein